MNKAAQWLQIAALSERMLQRRKGTGEKIGWEPCFYFPGSVIRTNVWLCRVRLVSPRCLHALSYLCFTTTGPLERLSKHIFHGTAWLITAKVQRKWAARDQNKLFRQISQPALPYVRACEIAAMFHLLQKMASNKVQSELGGRMVSCSRRTPRNQTTTDSIPVTAICWAAAAWSNALYPLPAILFANLELSTSSYEGEGRGRGGGCNKDEYVGEGSHPGWFALKRFRLCELNYWMKYSWQSDKREKWRQTILIQIIDDWSTFQWTGVSFWNNQPEPALSSMYVC